MSHDKFMKLYACTYACFILLLGANWLCTSCTLDRSPEFNSYPEVKINSHAAAPVAGFVRFSTNEPVWTRIEIFDRGELKEVLDFDTTHYTSEGFPLLGMRPNCDCAVVVSVTDVGGNEVLSDTLAITPPPLPVQKDTFPSITVSFPAPDKTIGNYTLLSVRRSRRDSVEFGENYGLLLVLDERGEVIWYYLTDRRISDVEILPNGHILYLTLDHELIEIDWLGNNIQTWYAARRPQGKGKGIEVDALTIHHEVDILPWGNFLVLSTEQREIDNYYTSETNPAAPRKRSKVMGDVILEISPEGDIVWSWNAFEYLDPFRIGYETFTDYWPDRGFPDTRDWSHGNGLFYNEKDSSIIASFRFQEALVKIDYKNRDIVWIMGDSTGWEKSYHNKLLKPEGDISWFYHQHAPSMIGENLILLFDNQNYLTMPFDPPVPRAETSSRAIVYKLDESARTVQQVWSSTSAEDVPWSTIAMGDADVISNGDRENIVVSYGAGKRKQHLSEERMQGKVRPNASKVVEYTFESSPQKVWEVIIEDETRDPANWAIYSHIRFKEWPVK